MPPPPPPGPPPPPPAGALPSATPGRKNLLSSIEKGTRLKSTKHLMNDRSGPFVEGTPDKTSASNGKKSAPSMAPPANGMMRPTNGTSSTGSRFGPPPSPVNNSSPRPPPPANKFSAAPPPPRNGFGSETTQRVPRPTPPPQQTASPARTWGNRTAAPQPPPTPVRHPAAPIPPSVQPSLTHRNAAAPAPPPPRPQNSFATLNKPSPPPGQSTRPTMVRSNTVADNGDRSSQLNSSPFPNTSSANRRFSAHDVHPPKAGPSMRPSQPHTPAPPPPAPRSSLRSANDTGSAPLIRQRGPAPPMSGPVFPPPVPPSKVVSPPALPPPRAPARSPMNNQMIGNLLESRFHFHSSKQLPRPERFRPSRKSYPSKHPHNKANRR